MELPAQLHDPGTRGRPPPPGGHARQTSTHGKRVWQSSATQQQCPMVLWQPSPMCASTPLCAARMLLSWWMSAARATCLADFRVPSHMCGGGPRVFAATAVFRGGLWPSSVISGGAWRSCMCAGSLLDDSWSVEVHAQPYDIVGNYSTMSPAHTIRLTLSGCHTYQTQGGHFLILPRPL